MQVISYGNRHQQKQHQKYGVRFAIISTDMIALKRQHYEKNQRQTILRPTTTTIRVHGLFMKHKLKDNPQSIDPNRKTDNR